MFSRNPPKFALYFCAITLFVFKEGIGQEVSRPIPQESQSLLAEAKERYDKAGRDWRFMALPPDPEGEDLLGFENPGDVPSFPKEGDLKIQKVLPVSCHLAKAFVIQPIDGQPDSLQYSSLVSEYDDAGFGSAHWELSTYEFLQRPGIHVTLAEEPPFNFISIRGGFLGEIYQDVDVDDGPGNGKKITTVVQATGPDNPKSHYQISRHFFPNPVKTNRVSFFRDKGLLGDIGVYRVGDIATGKAIREEDKMVFYLGPKLPMQESIGRAFLRMKAVEPEKNEYLTVFDRRFFRLQDRELISLQDKPGNIALEMPAGHQLHFLTEPMTEAVAIGGVRLDLSFASPANGAIFMMAVQDSLIGNHELLRFDAKLNTSKHASCILDFGDQVLPVGARVWITLACEKSVTLLPTSKFEIIKTNTKEATKEYVDQLLLRAKGIFSKIASARPWVGRKMNSKWWDDYDGSDWSLQRRRLLAQEMYILLERIQELEPNHPIAVNQYLSYLDGQSRSGETTPEIQDIQIPPGVPRWAVLLQRTLKSTVDVANWWLENRKSSQGEFGSILGDDTDLLQWWLPLVQVDSRFANDARPAFTQLAQLLLTHRLKNGVNLNVTDPLHAYEEGINHMCVMPQIFYGDPRYIEWLMESARSTRQWLEEDEKGVLRFRVDSFGYATLSPSGKDVQPTGQNISSALMLHPQLMLLWYNGNPTALKTLEAYAKGAGEYIEGGFRNGLSISFVLYWMTRDPKYLGLDTTAENGKINLKWAKGHPEFFIHGKEAHAAPWWQKIKANAEGDFIRGDTAWAAGQNFQTLEKSCEFALWGNPIGLWGGVEKYKYMWTVAEPVADRVFLPSPLIGQVMLGGFSVRNQLWPAYAVSYENFGDNFAAAVLEQGRERLRLVIYNLGAEPIKGIIHPWQLDNGKYEVRMGNGDDKGNLTKETEKVETMDLSRMASIAAEIPSHVAYVIDVRQVERYDDLLSRADLAFSPDDLRKDTNSLNVTVHNIGSKSAAGVKIALMGSNGEILASKVVDILEAPLDLFPRTVEVSFPITAGGQRIVIDPENKLPEITKLNNTLSLLEVTH